MTDAKRTLHLLLALFVLSACASTSRGQASGGKDGFAPRLEVVKKFDKDGDGRLNSAERRRAMAYLKGPGDILNSSPGHPERPHRRWRGW